MSYYGAGRSNFRRNHKLPYRSLSYGIFKPCTTLINRLDNTVRCRSTVRRVRSTRTHSNYGYPYTSNRPARVASSKYKTNVRSRGCKSVSGPPCTTGYGRKGGKDDCPISDDCVSKSRVMRHMTNYTASRTASLTPYKRYERKGLKNDYDNTVFKNKDMRHLTNYTASRTTSLTPYRTKYEYKGIKDYDNSAWKSKDIRPLTNYTASRPTSVTPYTRYERKGIKSYLDNCVLKKLTNYIPCRSAAVTPYTTIYERKGLKDDYHCNKNSETKDCESSVTVIGKDPYTNILNDESNYTIMNKSRAVSQENKLTQTKGSEIDRALAKAGDSTHAQNSRTKNNRLKMKGKTTYNLNVNRGEYKRRPIFKMNTNKEPRMKRESTIAIENMLAECATEIYKGKTHSKMNTERKSKLKRNQSSDSVQDAAHSATEHSGDEKSGPVSKNNKPKKNLFVRFMNFGQQWSRLSNNISYTEPKKTLRELRKSRKKCRKKTIDKSVISHKSVSTQSTLSTSGKQSHHRWNKPHHVSIVSTDNENESDRTLDPPANDNQSDDDDDLTEYVCDENKKSPNEERKIYYDEVGRKIYDDKGRKIDYDKRKDDTEEPSRNYSRRQRQTKDNKEDNDDYDDSWEINDKTEEFKKYSRRHRQTSKENDIDHDDTREITDKTEEFKNYSRRQRQTKAKENKENNIDDDDTREITDKTKESKNYSRRQRQTKEKKESDDDDDDDDDDDCEDDTREITESKNISRRPRQTKENDVDNEDTWGKTDNREKLFTKRSSPRNRAERRRSRRRDRRRDRKDRKHSPDIKRTDSNRTSRSESPEKNLNKSRRKNARNKKDRWSQCSPTGSNYTEGESSSPTRHERQNETRKQVQCRQRRSGRLRRSCCGNYNRRQQSDRSVDCEEPNLIEPKREWTNLGNRYNTIRQRNNLNPPGPVCRISSVPKQSDTMSEPTTWLRIPPRKSPLSFQENKQEQPEMTCRLPVLRIRI